MPGTEPPPTGSPTATGATSTPTGLATGTSTAALIRSLTTAGWLLLGGSIGMIAYQVRQVRELGGSSAFGGDVWDRRIEVLSFVMLPPNLVVLTPAVVVAVVAVWLAGSAAETWLLTLLRLCAGIAAALAVVGVVSIVSILIRDEAGPSDWGDIYLRLGGISMAAGLLVLCRVPHHRPSRRDPARSPHETAPGT